MRLHTETNNGKRHRYFPDCFRERPNEWTKWKSCKLMLFILGNWKHTTHNTQGTYILNPNHSLFHIGICYLTLTWVSVKNVNDDDDDEDNSPVLLTQFTTWNSVVLFVSIDAWVYFATQFKVDSVGFWQTVLHHSCHLNAREQTSKLSHLYDRWFNVNCHNYYVFIAFVSSWKCNKFLG